MNRLSIALAIFLLSTGANASQQISYNGHFVSGNGGSINVGDTFSGQYSFNPESPDLSAYLTNPSTIELGYLVPDRKIRFPTKPAKTVPRFF